MLRSIKHNNLELNKDKIWNVHNRKLDKIRRIKMFNNQYITKEQRNRQVEMLVKIKIKNNLIYLKEYWVIDSETWKTMKK